MRIENIRSILKNCIKKNLLLTLAMLLAVTAATLTGVLPPLVLERVINILTERKMPSLVLVLLYFGTLALSGLFDAAKEVLITAFGQKVTHECRSTLAQKLNRLPADYFTKHEPGDTVSCLVNDVNTVETLFTSGIISMATDALKIISVLIVIFTKSLGLGILIAAVTPILFSMTMVFQKRMLSAQKDNRAAVAAANAQIPETVHNIRTIHVLRRIPFMEDRYGNIIDRSFRAQEQSNFYDAIYSPIIIVTSAVIVAVMMSASVGNDYFMSLFGMSVGTAVAVISYVGKIFDPLESIGMEITNIQSALAGLSRINGMLAETEEDLKYERSDVEANVNIDNGVEKASALNIRELAFGYDNDPLLFTKFNLTADAGEMITVTGRTGAGKSTLFKLILGLYAPVEGKIRVFGRNPRTIPARERRSLYGYVEQQYRPVLGTVLEQVTLKDPTITLEKALYALRLCGLEETVQALPLQENTQYSPGLFSQGQLQLLSIARAICNDPHLLLLDEITANLDSGTERQVLAALQAASANRTVLSISHRLYETAGGRKVEM